MASPARSAVILLSGGLDSATVLAIAQQQGFRLLALSFRYGQRHAVEIDSAKRVAQALQVVRHVIVDIDLRTFGKSALTAEIRVPKGREESAMAAEIPVYEKISLILKGKIRTGRRLPAGTEHWPY